MFSSSHTAFISHPDCWLHEMDFYHPESPARLTAIEEALAASGLMERLTRFNAPIATREQLECVHTREHIAALEVLSPAAHSPGFAYIDPDTAMNRHSLKAAYRAAGAVILATDMVMEQVVQNAFCSVRPPGHHAERARAMGFCLFNNIAVGVAHAIEAHGLERVAIVDFDVHHGNGTEDIFHDDPRIMMVSTFQHPFYPYSGIAGRSERMINIPLAAGSSGAALRKAAEEFWLPALERFKPQILFVSAGFDGHRDDELASLNLVEDDYAWVTQKITEVASLYATNRVISTLEGGYDLPALGRSVCAHIAVLLDS
jgi:acetoin utilization deacetylase AcuC-like enzyme